MKEEKVLIITVGNKPDQTKASIKLNKPDKVIFICSKETIKKIKEICNETEITNYSEKIVKDINGYSETKKLVEELILENKNARIIVDITGGTKPMTSGATIAAIKHNKKMSYISGERDKQHGNTKTGTEQLEEIDPINEFIEKKEEKAINFFNRQYYLAAKKEFENISEEIKTSKINKNTVKYDLMQIFSEGYFFLSIFNFKKAIKQLNKLKEKLNESTENKTLKSRGLEEIKEKLYKQIEIINNLNKMSEKNPTEEQEKIIYSYLLQSAKQCQKLERYDDGMSRIYRALELLSQIALKEKHGINPSNITKEQHEKYPEQTKEKKTDKTKIITHGLNANYEILFKLKDELGKKFNESSELQDILQKRNNSLLAHGIIPVDKEEFEKAYKTIIKFKGIDEAHNTELIKIGKL